MRYLLMAAFAATQLAASAQDKLALNVDPTKPVQESLSRELPTDPLQRIAFKAVVLKEWPEAPAWKLAAYKRVIDEGITAHRRARRTTYCPHCSGTRCADGSRVRRGICAASKNVPMHSIIWLASDGLLKVTDRGGAVKPHHANGEAAHFDVWLPSCRGCYTGPGTQKRVPYAVILPGGK